MDDTDTARDAPRPPARATRSWGARLLRLLRHRWLDEHDARRALGPGALARLEERVVASERGHTGQVRLCVEAGLPLSYLWRDATARERALTMFGKLRVWDTEQNNGVLIYLLLADHRIEVVADRGVDRHVEPGHWRGIVDGMSKSFRARDYEGGLGAAIAAVDALLRAHYPAGMAAGAAAGRNELPDRPDVR